MFGYIVLILLIFFSVKNVIFINEHIQVMEEFKISNTKVRLLQISSILYILSLLMFIFSTGLPVALMSISIGLALLVPGVWLGKTVSKVLDSSGTSRTIKAKDISSNIMWLGMAVFVFISANLGFSYFISSMGKLPWE